MGLKDRFRGRSRDEVAETRSAMEAARDPQAADPGTVTRGVQTLLDVGIDGLGPLDSAVEVAERARAKSRTPQEAIGRVARSHLLGGSAGGVVTGLGGFVTMPVALPVNVLEFYVQATRMVAAIAHLRGYDVRDPQVRTAVLLTLIGSQSDDVLRKVGLSTGGGRATKVVLDQLPAAATLVINKAIGFRLLRSVGEKAIAKLGRGVPLAGGVVGGAVDGFMMKRIADQAMGEFVPQPSPPAEPAT